MSRLNIEDLLDRYLAGQTTPEENRLLEQWLSDHDTGGSDWVDLSAAKRKEWLDSLFHDVAPEAQIIPLRQSTLWLRSAVAIAAAAVILISLYIFWPASTRRAELTTLHVTQNHTELLALADGSKIWVNAGSILSYPKSFNGERREVALTGEAYFDIHHDSAKPFLIHTGKVVITVLGTAFNIKTDKTASGIIITVMRGKVSVSDSGHLLAYLTPDRQLRYNTATHEAVQENVTAVLSTGWQLQSEMQFNDITFAAAAKLLEQRFGVTISFANEKLGNCRFSGTIAKGKNLADILKIICSFNNANYRRDTKGNIIIDGKGCS